MARTILESPQTVRARIKDLLLGANLTRSAKLVTLVNALVTLNGLSTMNPATFGLYNRAGGNDVCSITSGAAVLTSPDNPFGSVVAGMSIDVAGAGAAGAVLSTTVLSVQNAGQITLAANASTTVTAGIASAGGLAMWGWPANMRRQIGASDPAGEPDNVFIDPATGAPKAFGGGATPNVQLQLWQNAGPNVTTASISVLSALLGGSKALPAGLAVGRGLRHHLTCSYNTGAAATTMTWLPQVGAAVGSAGSAAILPVSSSGDMTVETLMFLTTAGAAGIWNYETYFNWNISSGAAFSLRFGGTIGPVDMTVVNNYDFFAQYTNAGHNSFIRKSTVELLG